MSATDNAVEEETTLALQPPRRYAVVLKNDDYTPMDFVVHLLTDVFSLSEEKAVAVMLEVHMRGKGVAGIYSKEVAETKVAHSLSLAKDYGHPFLCVIEPA